MIIDSRFGEFKFRFNYLAFLINLWDQNRACTDLYNRLITKTKVGNFIFFIFKQQLITATNELNKGLQHIMRIEQSIPQIPDVQVDQYP